MSVAPQAPLISVIVPVYDVEDHVAACIASIRAQRLRDFEAIVVDDGARDQSHARALQAIDGDPRFRVIRQANAGLSAARNTGLDHARGHFIAFVDSDDRIEPDYLAELHAALEQSGADWAFCGIRNAFPDGTHNLHSAVHSAPALDQEPPPPPHPRPLESWAEVIDLFPSAWNKLYRRSLIEGLRFDVGTLYEDHAFYHQAARRAGSIVQVSRPLYVQTRARPGQLTGEDSPRVFDQFGVLERLSGLMDASKAGPVPAFATLASRLVFERAAVIRDLDRRAAFLTEARALFERHSLRYMPDWTKGIGPSLGLELAGRCPLSIVVLWDGSEDLRATLGALAEITPCGEEMLIACDGCPPEAALAIATEAGLQGDVQAIASPAPGPGAARNAALDEAVGDYMIFLDAGDQVAPWAPLHQVGAMLHFGAEMGLMPFHAGPAEDAPLLQGFHDETAAPAPPDRPTLLEMTPDLVCNLHCHPSAKIFDRAFLLAHGIGFGTGALSDWHLGIRSALLARRVLRFDTAGYRVARLQPLSGTQGRAMPSDLSRVIDRIGEVLPEPARQRLPEGWRHRLLARALRDGLSDLEGGPLVRASYVWAAAGAVARLPPLPEGATLDPALGPRLTRLISASGRSRLHCIARLLGR